MFNYRFSKIDKMDSPSFAIILQLGKNILRFATFYQHFVIMTLLWAGNEMTIMDMYNEISKNKSIQIIHERYVK